MNKKRLQELTPELKSIYESIWNGEVYAHIESVAPSGMSRRILFYRINRTDSEPYDETCESVKTNDYYIERITREIGWLSGALKWGESKQGGKYVYESGLFVSGCGMDMIFHTLYNCIDHEEVGKWKQKYNTL